MADYAKYKTETLQKMHDRAFDRYIELCKKPCGNWGDGMRKSRLPSATAWEQSRNRCKAIADEIERRTGRKPVKHI